MKFKQHDGDTLNLGEHPKRIISLVPSVTEELILLGCLPVGKTSFCIFPELEVAPIPSIGGTKSPSMRLISKLRPDLIIANKEENRKEDILELQEKGYKVWVQYPYDVPSTIETMEEMLQLAKEPVSYSQKLFEFRKDVNTYQKKYADLALSFLFLIWKDPWMAAGQNTYIHSIFEYMGLKNIVFEERYPEVNIFKLLKNAPLDLLFLPSEPYAFTLQHKNEILLQLPKGAKEPWIINVSGEDFTWPGKRILSAMKCISQNIEQLKIPKKEALI